MATVSGAQMRKLLILAAAAAATFTACDSVRAATVEYQILGSITFTTFSGEYTLSGTFFSDGSAADISVTTDAGTDLTGTYNVSPSLPGNSQLRVFDSSTTELDILFANPLSNNANDPISNDGIFLSGYESGYLYNGMTLGGAGQADPVATPLPAALPLFATALGGLGLLGWRRKRKNTAAIAAA